MNCIEITITINIVIEVMFPLYYGESVAMGKKLYPGV